MSRDGILELIKENGIDMVVEAMLIPKQGKDPDKAQARFIGQLVKMLEKERVLSRRNIITLIENTSSQ